MFPQIRLCWCLNGLPARWIGHSNARADRIELGFLTCCEIPCFQLIIRSTMKQKILGLKALSLSLAVALSSLGVGLAARPKAAPNLDPHYSAREISTSWDSGKIAEGLSAQLKANPVVMLTARDRGTHINLRSQPTVRSRAIGYGLPGDQVNLLQCVQDRDTAGSDLNWCRVQFLVSGAVGWIRSDFIIFPSDGE
ncbi:MAG: SH3 domain-containing protein [Leptolyngbyaceae cyanobacterium SM2_5_2]|nr:SH3 domain-containing protein [Leptolyngbyaceae cyanobacterium SM2_5_2]